MVYLPFHLPIIRKIASLLVSIVYYLFTWQLLFSAMDMQVAPKKNGKLISNPTMPVFVLLKTESTMGKVSESHQHDKLELHFICQRLFVCLFLSNY